MTTSTIDATPDADAQTRRLATIETITGIFPIDGADAIVRARVRGWDVVVKLGEFTPGQACVYFEVDSLLDVNDPRFAFLAPRGVRTDAAGNRGHVLKTARLRGQYSQGLALPTTEFPELGPIDATRAGEDVTDILGVTKWEPPIPANLVGAVRGMLPGWIVKTDEDRLQNTPAILAASDACWVPTEKLDGTSTTFFLDGDYFGVGSRNLDLLETEHNTLWRLARDLDIETRLREGNLGARVALQGEAHGEGIQGNPLRLHGQHFAAFTLRVDGVEIPRGDWPDWMTALSVPAYNLPFPTSVEQALAQVEKLDSLRSPGRAAEGIVWRAGDVSHVTLPDGRNTRASFKVISNRYLLKNDR